MIDLSGQQGTCNTNKGNSKVDNSLVFVSHAADDRKYAATVADFIECTMQGVSTFVASDPASISSGGDWFQAILANLSKADALVVIYSRNGRNRMWVGFELGHFWRRRDGEKIHCIFDPQVDVPSPLNVRQAKDFTDVASMAMFFSGLADDLGRNYVVDDIGISHIVDAAPEYEEFATWKSLLQIGQWSERELSGRHGNKTVWTSDEDQRYQIENTYEVESKNFSEPCIKGFPDPHRSSSWVELKVSGATIEQVLFVSLDGGRYFVPMPEQRVTENEDGSIERNFFYDRSSLRYQLGNVIGRFYIKDSLVQFAIWKGIEIF